MSRPDKAQAALNERLTRRVVSLRNDGLSSKDIAEHVGISVHRVYRYQKKFYNRLKASLQETPGD